MMKEENLDIKTDDEFQSDTQHSMVDIEEHETEHDNEEIDFSKLNKQQLVEFLKSSLKETNLHKVDQILKGIQPAYNEIFENEKEEALKKYIDEGGQHHDFQYRSDEYDVAFTTFYTILRDRRNNFFRELEEQKAENLRLKNKILEKLRLLLDSEDNEDTFKKFKNIQKEWNAIGTVSILHSKTTWANYYALVDRFYDQRSIYFELKELDRKKNLEQKTEICEKAELLLQEDNIPVAIKHLSELHHEFKSIGPVPLAEKDDIWFRFKKASDAIYEKRDAHHAAQRMLWDTNLSEKLKLVDELKPFADFNTNRITEWNKKSKEIYELQKKWEHIGFVPRAQLKDVNKQFWTIIKSFFQTRHIFFKQIAQQRKETQALRENLIHQAEALKESKDWEETTQTMKALQLKWKELGYSPDRFQEITYKRFKEACDYFFEQKKNKHKIYSIEQEENLKIKETILAEMEAHIVAHTTTLELFRDYQKKFNEVGFVPRTNISDISMKWDSVTLRFLDGIPEMSRKEKEKEKMTSKLSELKNDPHAQKKLAFKEQSLRKKITQIENEIVLLRNNLEFFRHSKNADQLRHDVNKKIETEEENVKTLKLQLQILRES